MFRIIQVVEEITTHILRSITIFRKSCRLCDNVENHGGARETTDDNIIRRMRFACWITEVTSTQTQTHTLIICNTYCLSTATIVMRTRLIFTSCVYCLSCSGISVAISYTCDVTITAMSRGNISGYISLAETRNCSVKYTLYQSWQCRKPFVRC
jgi:hypothetical protein